MDTLIIIGAKYLFIVVGLLAVIVTLLSKRTARSNIIKLAIFSFPIAFLLALLAGRLFYDTRPFVIENIEPLVPHEANNGFPSDHTLLAMVAASTIFIYRRKFGVFLGILAVLVGVFRMMAKLHYPLDIAASIMIAMATTCIVWMLLKRYVGGRYFE